MLAPKSAIDLTVRSQLSGFNESRRYRHSGCVMRAAPGSMSPDPGYSQPGYWRVNESTRTSASGIRARDSIIVCWAMPPRNGGTGPMIAMRSRLELGTGGSATRHRAESGSGRTVCAVPHFPPQQPHPDLLQHGPVCGCEIGKEAYREDDDGGQEQHRRQDQRLNVPGAVPLGEEVEEPGPDQQAREQKQRADREKEA